MYDQTIGVVEYEEHVEPQLPFVIEKLNKDLNTRQAILTINQGENFNSCMINLQLQFHNDILYVTVNFRSQAKEFQSLDGLLINYIITKILSKVSFKPKKIKTTCNVGNFHTRFKK